VMYIEKGMAVVKNADGVPPAGTSLVDAGSVAQSNAEQYHLSGTLIFLS
jgi:hypothetical protein